MHATAAPFGIERSRNGAHAYRSDKYSECPPTQFIHIELLTYTAAMADMRVSIPVWHFTEAYDHPPLANAIYEFNQTAIRVAADLLNEYAEVDARFKSMCMDYGVAMKRLIKDHRAPMKYIVGGVQEATRHLELFLAAKRASAAARKPGASAATIDAATDAVKAEIAAMQATQRAFMWATACDECGKTSSGQRACKACHTARYCSRKCQLAAWPAHKAACKAARKEAQQATGSDDTKASSSQ